jgi:hypothetical protein
LKTYKDYCIRCQEGNIINAIYKPTKIGNSNTVYVIQDIPGTKIGAPKINIIGATQYGQLKVLLPENSQIILSPAYVITTLKQKLKRLYIK